MADFCTSCARELGFKEPDLDIQAIADDAGNGYMYDALCCEGCGLIGVGKEQDGSVFVIEYNGERRAWDPEEDRMTWYDRSSREEENSPLPDKEIHKSNYESIP